MSALILIPEPYPLFIPLRNGGLPRKIAEDCSVSNKWWKEIWTADVKFSYLENVKRSVEIRKGGEREEEEEEGGGGEGERKDARATGHGNKFDNNKEKHFTWSRNRFAEFVAGQDLLERDDTLCFSLASCPWQRWFFYSNWIEKRILVESLKSPGGSSRRRRRTLVLSEIYSTVNRDSRSEFVLLRSPLTSKNCFL